MGKLVTVLEEAAFAGDKAAFDKMKELIAGNKVADNPKFGGCLPRSTTIHASSPSPTTITSSTSNRETTGQDPLRSSGERVGSRSSGWDGWTELYVSPQMLKVIHRRPTERFGCAFEGNRSCRCVARNDIVR